MNTYKLNFLERAWLIKYELAIGGLKLPCLFLLDSPYLNDELLAAINYELRENIYNWQEFEEIKNLLVDKVHPEYNGLNLIRADLEDSVIADVTTVNHIQWFFLKDKLPFLNCYQAD